MLELFPCASGCNGFRVLIRSASATRIWKIKIFAEPCKTSRQARRVGHHLATSSRPTRRPPAYILDTFPIVKIKARLQRAREGLYEISPAASVLVRTIDECVQSPPCFRAWLLAPALPALCPVGGRRIVAAMLDTAGARIIANA